MNLDNIDNYIRPATLGRQAFEDEYVTTEVVFERMDGTYLTWNYDPFNDFNDGDWLEGIREDISIEYIKENYFPLNELAEQLGFRSAKGMDF